MNNLNIECRYCKRNNNITRCLRKGSGQWHRAPLTGIWTQEIPFAWELCEYVKAGKARWPCEPKLTRRGKWHYRKELKDDS